MIRVIEVSMKDLIQYAFWLAIAIYAITAIKCVIVNSFKRHREASEERVVICRMIRFIKAGKIEEAVRLGNHALGIDEEVKP